MAVPKKKTSKSKRNMRRSHDALSPVVPVSECPNCGAKVLSHNVCENCGWYRGKKIAKIPANNDAD